MKIYVVFINMYHDSHHILKAFSDLNKAIDYAADFAMTRTNQYDRNYLKKIMIDQHDDPTSDGYIFVYTHYNNMDIDDEFIGIREIDVEE